VLSDALIGMGVTKTRAAEIAGLLNNRATALMNIERQLSLGITEGKWLYSGAPCHLRSPPTDEDYRRDSAHRVASGKRYRLSKGLAVDGRLTHPGREPGCKCALVAAIPGFHD
jgi:hypothetical protein